MLNCAKESLEDLALESAEVGNGLSEPLQKTYGNCWSAQRLVGASWATGRNFIIGIMGGQDGEAGTLRPTIHEIRI